MIGEGDPAAGMGLEGDQASGPRPLPHRADAQRGCAAAAPPIAPGAYRAAPGATSSSRWRRRVSGIVVQTDGPDIDIDAYLRFAADRRGRRGGQAMRCIATCAAVRATLACQLMADLAVDRPWVDDHQRVIDVIRDSLWLLRALDATGGSFCDAWFLVAPTRSGMRAHPEGIRRTLRQQRAQPDRRDQARLLRAWGGLTPRQPHVEHPAGGRRLLLLLTDGKPNDLDQ